MANKGNIKEIEAKKPDKTPLMVAIETRNVTRARELLEKGANINDANIKAYKTPNGTEYSAFELAIEKRSTKMVELLSEYGAKLENSKLNVIFEGLPKTSDIYWALYNGVIKNKNRDESYFQKLESHKPEHKPVPLKAENELPVSAWWKFWEQCFPRTEPYIPRENKPSIGSNTKKPEIKTTTSTSASPGHKGPKPP